MGVLPKILIEVEKHGTPKIVQTGHSLQTKECDVGFRIESEFKIPGTGKRQTTTEEVVDCADSPSLSGPGD